ncbi:MAG: DNA (cytosine-5-)-methyltransferase [Coriobacteriales bacterium]|jgi:DNA (cytosine-5)-methyltransferase 1|nr:DNA (cytosine-5-)-methyltransferase [Coriobacteriales bacterium]
MAAKSNRTLTYVSLFSSAGVGCYGFKQEGFDCIATNELIERRLQVQKYNNKCKYESGYINGDITKSEIQESILAEISKWKKQDGIKDVDVLIATPPCQGMSVANHKKGDELNRNSLVVEAIRMISTIKPRFFVFENVAAFLKTTCTDIDGKDKTIHAALFNNLDADYSIYHRIINFKNYGSFSSRTRTLLIGVRKDLADYISPIELFPDFVDAKTIREVIGDLPALSELGSISSDDFYHAFRPYQEHMRTWIHDLKEGQSAFDNADPNKIPHRVVNGQVVLNKRKNGDKYTRQYWNQVAPCIHTRNDQLASQNTVHPKDDRVFSIRELMRFMSIPDKFRWLSMDVAELNELTTEEKSKLYKREAVNIRQSIGEAVPTAIFRAVAHKIKERLADINLDDIEIERLIKRSKFKSEDEIVSYIDKNPDNLSIVTLVKIAEYANPSRSDNAAYFTDKSKITRIINELPEFKNDEMRILEPSVGVGNFVFLVLKHFQYVKKLTIDCMDIDPYAIRILALLLKKKRIRKNAKINIAVGDSLTHEFKFHYDLVIGNPPFGRVNGEALKGYRAKAENQDTANIFAFFIERAASLGDVVSLIIPKALLNAPEFKQTRRTIQAGSILSIIDFGELGFRKVLIETIDLIFSRTKISGTKVNVFSVPQHFAIAQRQNYICSLEYPYWLIYRNAAFDATAEKLTFNVFDSYRDRQVTNKCLSDSGRYPVIRSRNISDDGHKIVNIEGYDKYLADDINANGLNQARFINDNNVYLTPNMTYKPRVIKKPKATLVNGSVAILTPKTGVNFSRNDLDFFSSNEFRHFYKTARNYQTRSLNIDKNSVYFFGKLK